MRDLPYLSDATALSPPPAGVLVQAVTDVGLLCDHVLAALLSGLDCCDECALKICATKGYVQQGCMELQACLWAKNQVLTPIAYL
jgi:hypothetical protein